MFTIDIKTKSGCLTTDTLLVKTIKKVEIYVPTAFTPNRDGSNDFLRPILRGIKQVQFFKVFNRWGELVFQMKNDRPGWDGNFNGSPQQAQTVVWMLEGIGVDGKVYKEKGMSVLLR